MPSKPCARPGCPLLIIGKPTKLARQRYCSRSCAAQMNRARHGLCGKVQETFTDAELIEKLAVRSEWVYGSRTFANLLRAASERLEQLTKDQDFTRVDSLRLLATARSTASAERR